MVGQQCSWSSWLEPNCNLNLGLFDKKTINLKFASLDSIHEGVFLLRGVEGWEWAKVELKGRLSSSSVYVYDMCSCVCDAQYLYVAV